MNITVNGQARSVAPGSVTADIITNGSDDLWLLNGFAVDGATPLKEGDALLRVSRTEAPDEATYDAVWNARYGKTIYNKLKSSHIPSAVPASWLTYRH